jgi:hypothetical protein
MLRGFFADVGMVRGIWELLTGFYGCMYGCCNVTAYY